MTNELSYDKVKTQFRHGLSREENMGGEAMDKLEKVVADLKHLDSEELTKVWGFALGLLASRPVDQAA